MHVGTIILNKFCLVTSRFGGRVEDYEFFYKLIEELDKQGHRIRIELIGLEMRNNR